MDDAAASLRSDAESRRWAAVAHFGALPTKNSIPHYGHFHTPATLRRLDSDRLQYQQCKQPLPAIPDKPGPRCKSLPPARSPTIKRGERRLMTRSAGVPACFLWSQLDYSNRCTHVVRPSRCLQLDSLSQVHWRRSVVRQIGLTRACKTQKKVL